jgi:3-oxoacyl-[acyl-carrier-protein] synthase II
MSDYNESAHAPREKVVVTGLGAVTPLGPNVATSWEALLEGKSGVREITDEWAADLPTRVAAPLPFDPLDSLDRVKARRMDRSAQLGILAVREAFADAGFGENGTSEVPAERLGVVFGTGIGGLSTVVEQYKILEERGPSRVNPLTVPMIMPNAAAAVVGLELGARAGVHAPVSACATSAEAIAMGMQMVRDGRADVVVVGGTEAVVNRLALAAFSAMRAMSTRNDDPTRASRPYDIDRDGFVMGEGAGALVLETEAHAKARGARIYLELAGAGMSADAYHIAAPEPEGAGAAAAIRNALKDARVLPSDVVTVNAHATSTPLGDIAESKAIRAAFGADADHIAVTAPKSSTGHLLGGAGVVESIFTILSLINRIVPATLNVDNMDPEINLDVVIGEPRKLGSGRIAGLNNSFGFGGHNVSVVFVDEG